MYTQVRDYTSTSGVGNLACIESIRDLFVDILGKMLARNNDVREERLFSGQIPGTSNNYPAPIRYGIRKQLRKIVR